MPTPHPLAYPIGPYRPPDPITPADRSAWIGQIAALPAQLAAACGGLTEAQLDTPYRDGGWTVRQTVHHVADSHLNSYTRFRLALTEDNPVVKPYEEARWAELTDARTAPVALSLTLLEALHARWVLLLESLPENEWVRTFRHPQLGEVTLGRTLGLYAWHGAHHLAQITALARRQGWNG